MSAVRAESPLPVVGDSPQVHRAKRRARVVAASGGTGMRIGCIGAGPAGLYAAISIKLRRPEADVIVHERNAEGVTFGWGVVFSDQTMANLRGNDARSAAQIESEFAHWDDIEVALRSQRIRSRGHGFIGIGRRRLLTILTERARELGVTVEFDSAVTADDLAGSVDLVVAADGINSATRDARGALFGTEVEHRANKFIWLGTAKSFDAFTFAFEQTEAGWIWAHAYRFQPDCSTFIVECSEATWAGLGFDRLGQAEAIARCEEIFAAHLEGASLLSNAAHLDGPAAWLNFRRIRCERWFDGNIVLVGDAAHSAHFSIGSGTKLALEDAITLADVVCAHDGPPADALNDYQAAREIEVLRLQNSARNSTEWFETIDRYLDFEPWQFAYSLLTRSQRISHENLRLRDPEWVAEVERQFWLRETGEARAAPPMFAPLGLRAMTLANRIVVSPMATYSASDGTPDDFHLVHYGARASGGAGLVFTEMTCVSPSGRITPGCTGLYRPEHGEAWRRIVEYVHRHTPAKFCLQLGHSGAKGSTRLGWEGMDEPLAEGNWPLIAASDVPWTAGHQRPRPMSRADMDEVRDQFVAATRIAADVGFDMIELHAAHGYLLSSFLTPLQNRRTDDYGGSLANRLRYPLELFTAMRAAWPAERPMSVRISASDWAGDEGVTPDEAVSIARAFADAGADLIDVSAGQTWAEAKPIYGRLFQTPFADQLRNEGGVKVMAVGNITDFDQANGILAAGRADLVALGRPHLIDPMWTLRAAAAQDYRAQWVPPPYLNGMAQLARLMQREAEMRAAELKP
jgi:anthraniloyl-CoA monooxygenase